MDVVGVGNNVLHLHNDHLGSNSVMSYNSGAGEVAGSRTRYLPFGDYRTAPTQTFTDRGYTGHLHDDGLGLVYMNARYYVRSIGRFASADSMVPEPANPQSFNRYSYVYNRPLNLVDPTGHHAEVMDGGRTCQEWHGCPQHQIFVKPFSPTYPDDPRGAELISIGCLGERCRVLPSLVPVYLAREGVEPGAARSANQREVGEILDAAAAGFDMSATATSSGFVGVQAVLAVGGGPVGPDDAIVTAAYAAADQVENWYSRLGAGFVITGDVMSGETDLNQDRVIIGQDTMVLGLTTWLGEAAGVPPVIGPSLDTIVNLAVNVYDLGRLSGGIPTMFELRRDDSGVHVVLYEP